MAPAELSSGLASPPEHYNPHLPRRRKRLAAQQSPRGTLPPPMALPRDVPRACCAGRCCCAAAPRGARRPPPCYGRPRSLAGPSTARVLRQVSPHGAVWAPRAGEARPPSGLACAAASRDTPVRQPHAVRAFLAAAAAVCVLGGIGTARLAQGLTTDQLIFIQARCCHPSASLVRSAQMRCASCRPNGSEHCSTVTSTLAGWLDRPTALEERPQARNDDAGLHVAVADAVHPPNRVQAWKAVDRAYVDKSFNGQPWFKLREQYLKREPMQDRNEAYAAVRKLLATLDDPFTRFLEPERYAALRRGTSGVVTGVGLEVAFSQAEATRGKLLVRHRCCRRTMPCWRSSNRPLSASRVCALRAGARPESSSHLHALAGGRPGSQRARRSRRGPGSGRDRGHRRRGARGAVAVRGRGAPAGRARKHGRDHLPRESGGALTFRQPQAVRCS